MSKLPILSGQEIVQTLKRAGYRVMWQRGSHIRLECLIPGRKRITVPNYKDVDKSLLHKILRNAEITAEEFLRLFKE